MASEDDPDLQRRLERLQAAMGPKAAARAARRERRRESRARKNPASAAGLLPIAVAFIAVAIATGKSGLLIPGIILAVIAAARLLGAALKRPEADPTKPHIGMGATVAPGAIVEPGAVVEMGATIGAGAVIRRGAVVRMGSTVHENAVIEGGAVVGWGCDIKEGALVEAGAVIGSGATVNKGARVPTGMRVAAGVSYAGNSTPQPAPAPGPKDERRDRIESACARIETELKALPQTFREHLGATAETSSALRTTCLELLAREKTLRAEASGESLAFLDTERSEIEKRVAAASDEQVKRSLSSAIAAIDDQKKQRLQLKTHADRIEAEVTRLQWTLEGMATQLTRLRSAGVDASKPPSDEVLSSVQQLHSEIDAIADALEHVRETDSPMLQPISEISAPEDGGGSPERGRVR